VYRLELREGADPVRAMRDVASVAAPARLEMHRPSLEDIFIRIVHADSSLTEAAV
jgi:hypothetical protein